MSYSSIAFLNLPCPAPEGARAAPLLPQRHRNSIMGWLVAGLLFLAVLGVSAIGAPPQGGAVDLERTVKAAFLLKFLGYVDYPEGVVASGAAPLTVGVIADNEISMELARITAGRTMNGHPVTVRRLQPGDSLAGLHMLFIGADGDGQPERVLRQAQGMPILTVTENDRGLRQGSVINFRVVEERVRFEVSLESAEKNNIKLSSRLLAVAYQVQKGR